MPVAAHLKSRLEKDQESLKIQAERIQNIIAENEDNSAGALAAIDREKTGLKTVFNMLLGSIGNDLTQLTKKSVNYYELAQEFDATNRALRKSVYKQFLQDEVKQISLVYNILTQKTRDADDIVVLLNSASRLVSLANSMIKVFRTLAVKY